MRLLIVTPEYPPHSGGGILKYYSTLAPALSRQGCDVTVLVAAPTSPDFESYSHGNVSVVCIRRELVDRHAERLAQFSAASEFRRWLAGGLAAADVARELPPVDVIEATDFGLAFAPFVLQQGGPPLVVQMHGSFGQIGEREPAQPDRLLDHALTRLAEVTLLPFADDLQTYSTGNAREWSERLQRPVTAFLPPLEPVPPATPGRREDALVVGRVQSWKGPALLCEAMSLVPESAVRRVRWVGRDTLTGPGRTSLSAHLAATYPEVWGSRILPAGQQPFTDIQRLMTTTQMVIVPSDWDVFNLTAAEAMSSGQIVVCSSGAGASDLVETGKNGFVFAAGDARALAEALRAAAALTPDERNTVGQAARETIMSNLDPVAVAEARLARYQHVLARHEAEARPVPDWLAEVFSDHRMFRVGTEFLDQLAVRDLSQYLGRRLRDGVLERVVGSGRQS